MTDINKIISLIEYHNLTFQDLFEDEEISPKKLDLILRALEGKLLNIPERLEKANKNVDFMEGKYQAIMVDVTDMCSEMSDIVVMLRELLPKPPQGGQQR